MRATWNSLLAAFVFQHPGIAALRRELLRNAQLREVCGFDPFAAAAAVPSECAYTRFQRRLFKHEQELEVLFHQLVERLLVVLPDLGQVLALDGKELHSYASKESSPANPERHLRAARLMGAAVEGSDPPGAGTVLAAAIIDLMRAVDGI